MAGVFHPCEKLFNAGVNHRTSFIRPCEFLYSLHGIESQQGNELHLLPSSRINNSAPWYPEMFRAAILEKISLRNIFSYAFASAGLVQPCQIRAIIHIPMI
jgi:hypothetical protein